MPPSTWAFTPCCRKENTTTSSPESAADVEEAARRSEGVRWASSTTPSLSSSLQSASARAATTQLCGKARRWAGCRLRLTLDSCAPVALSTSTISFVANATASWFPPLMDANATATRSPNSQRVTDANSSPKTPRPPLAASAPSRRTINMSTLSRSNQSISMPSTCTAAIPAVEPKTTARPTRTSPVTMTPSDARKLWDLYPLASSEAKAHTPDRARAKEGAGIAKHVGN
mmetsp:Transcript_45551/g.120342  ORF Transcript_45551/g.120342 Transcript_45551/m.120342 type:complete len:230 (-) Transcript_45551:4-693(-)